MDYYAVLGLDPRCSTDEVKRAYRRLAVIHHPDRNPGDPDAAARFQEIAEAYGVLSQPGSRARYDLEREDAREPRLRPHRRRSRWLDARDGASGALIAVCLTLAAHGGVDGGARDFATALGTSLAAGFAVTWATLAALREVDWFRSSWASAGVSLFAHALGLAAAYRAAHVVAESALPVLPDTGIFYALAGGILGGLVGAAAGRSFIEATSLVLAIVAGVTTGALLGGLAATLLWYWGSVLAWTQWPVDESASVSAFAGVVGAFFGSAAAAAIGLARQGDASAPESG